MAINSSIRRLKGHRLIFCLGAPQRWAADCGGRSTSTLSITFRLSCWLSQWMSCTIEIFGETARPSPPRPITPQPTVRGAKHQAIIPCIGNKLSFHHSPFPVVVIILEAADQEERQQHRHQEQDNEETRTTTTTNNSQPAHVAHNRPSTIAISSRATGGYK